ncbi:MAG TPA: serine/threonine-protein kinase [bacterium]|nr:serine/threonine-protein kinase [bacterium]
MSGLSDDTVRHLKNVADLPDLGGTRYDVLERIGSGGMGTVYRARDHDLGRDVALKVLRETPAADTLAARMLQEARILARLEHPGIVPVHDVGRLSDGRVWYAMKLVRGDRLDRHAARTAAALPERLRLFLRVCEAVAFAHAHGVVHRDLKPANIMIGPFGEVLVLDWGVAKVMSSGDVPDDDADTVVAGPVSAETTAAADGETLPGTVLGTPGYMAPEQASGRPDLVGPRSDVYSLGGILQDLLAGSGPAPRPLRAVRDRARAEDPAARYAEVEELADDVRRFLDGSAVNAYREGAAERAARFVRKYRTPILVIVGYVVIRTLVFLWAGT